VGEGWGGGKSKQGKQFHPPVLTLPRKWGGKSTLALIIGEPGLSTPTLLANIIGIAPEECF